MSPKDINGRPPITAWQTSSLRLTAFPSPSAVITEQNWWEEITGEKPETSRSQPRSGEYIDEGTFQQGKLVLRINPIRVDWQYRPVEDSESQSQFPSVGTFTESLESFKALANMWFRLASCPSMVRLAFGAVLLQPVNTSETGYELLSHYLPFTVDTEGTSDFLYQINRARDSATRGDKLRINRLTKWAVLAIRQGVFSTASPTIKLLPDTYACSLELDINTSPDFEGEFASNELSSLFDELTVLGTELATKGDIP